MQWSADGKIPLHNMNTHLQPIMLCNAPTIEWIDYYTIHHVFSGIVNRTYYSVIDNEMRGIDTKYIAITM